MLLDSRLIIRDRPCASSRYQRSIALDSSESYNDMALGPIEFSGLPHGYIRPLDIVRDDACFDHGGGTVIKIVEAIEDTDVPYVAERFYLVDRKREYGKLFRVNHKHSKKRVRRYVIDPIYADKSRTLDLVTLTALKTMVAVADGSHVALEEIMNCYMDALYKTRVVECVYDLSIVRFDIQTLIQTMNVEIEDAVRDQSPIDQLVKKIGRFIAGGPSYRCVDGSDHNTITQAGMSQVNVHDITSRFYKRRIDTTACPQYSNGKPMAPYVEYFSEFLDEITALNLTDFKVFFRDTGRHTPDTKIDYLVNRYAYFQDLQGLLPENEITPALYKTAVAGYAHMYGLNGNPIDVEIVLTYDEEVQVTFHEEGAEPMVHYFDLNRCALLAPVLATNTIASSVGSMTDTDTMLDMRDVDLWS